MSHHDDLPYLVIERRSAGLGTLLTGALIGAGLALLFAPRSGRETRDEIRNGLDRVRDRAEDAVRTVQQTFNDTLGEVREQVGDHVDAARSAFDAGRQAARDTRDTMEVRVREAKAGVRTGFDTVREENLRAGADGAALDGSALDV
jgi:gas vesicle protein